MKTPGQRSMNFNALSENSSSQPCFHEFFSKKYFGAKFQIACCLPGGREAGGEGESAIGMKCAFGGIRCEDIGECGAE